MSDVCENHLIQYFPFKAYIQLLFREICQMMPALFMSKWLNFHVIVSQKPSKKQTPSSFVTLGEIMCQKSLQLCKTSRVSTLNFILKFVKSYYNFFFSMLTPKNNLEHQSRLHHSQSRAKTDASMAFKKFAHFLLIGFKVSQLLTCSIDGFSAALMGMPFQVVATSSSLSSA